MSYPTILVLLFLGLSGCIWMLLVVSLKGYERYETVFTESAETRLESLFLFFDARRIFFINLALLLLLPVAIYLLLENWFYVALTVMLLLIVPKLLIRFMEHKRRQAINLALPDALSQIAGGMRAGATFVSSVETMIEETKGPISQEFSLVLREQRLGKTLDEALDNLAERVNSEEMDLVVSASQISRNVGGNLAEIFERLSHTLRRKMEMEGKIKSLTAQGKLQGWVVGLLPFGIIGALFFVEPDGIRPIFSSLLGWIFLSVIILLEILGGIMIRKIVNIDV